MAAIRIVPIQREIRNNMLNFLYAANQRAGIATVTTPEEIIASDRAPQATSRPQDGNPQGSQEAGQHPS